MSLRETLTSAVLKAKVTRGATVVTATQVTTDDSQGLQSPSSVHIHAEKVLHYHQGVAEKGSADHEDAKCCTRLLLQDQVTILHKSLCI